MTVKTHDLYADMSKDLQHFDISTFPPDHPLYSKNNYRVLGKFKSETGSRAPREFVGLRATLYSPDVLNKQSHIKVKGVKKHYVKKNVRHDNFLAVLRQNR